MEKELKNLILKYKTCIEQLNEINIKAEKVNSSEKVIVNHLKVDSSLEDNNDKINQILNKLKLDVDTVLNRRKSDVIAAKLNVQYFIDNLLWNLFSRTELQNNSLLFDNDQNRRKDKKLLQNMINVFIELDAMDQDKDQEEEYAQQLHEWIVHVSAIYLNICSKRDKKALLELLTTTSNISTWAIPLIQFNDLDNISDYLEILDIVFTNKSNSNKWVEDDYLAVLDQLAIDFSFNKLIIESNTNTEEDTIKFIFDSTQQLTDILIHGINSLSTMNDLVKRLSQTLIQISMILCEAMSIEKEVQEKIDDYLTHLTKEFYSQKKSGWFFLQNIPFKSLSVNGLWNITVHLLQLKDIKEKPTCLNQVLNENLPNVTRFQFELKDNQLNSYFILTCLTNITTCIQQGVDLNIQDENSILSTCIITIISYTLFTIAFVDKNLREVFYKDVRDNFNLISKYHPFIISLLFRWTTQHISIMERMALYLFHSLSLNNWVILNDDLKLLHGLLSTGGSNSTAQLQLGKYILDHLNYGYVQGTVDSTTSKSQPWHNRKLPFLSYDIHEEIAFILLDACQQFQPLPDTTIAENKGAIELMGSVTSAVTSYLPTDQILLLKSATTSATSPANEFIQWAWSVALRLKLYDCKVSPRATDVDSSITLPFLKLVLNSYNEVSSSHSALLIYISFALSATSRHFLRFESSDGWMKLLTILKRGKGQAIIQLFSEMIPSFVYMHGDDFFNDESLIDFLKHMVELKQDPMLAKSSQDKTSNGIQVILSSHIWQAHLIDSVSNLLDENGKGFSYVDLVMHSWLKTIFRKPDWMWHTGYVNMMDCICRLAFTLHRHTHLYHMLVEEQKHLESTKLQNVNSSPRLTRFIKNMIPVTEGGFTTLLVGEWSLLNVKANTFNKYSPGIETQLHWFAFEALVTETVIEYDPYREEIIQLAEGQPETINDINTIYKLSSQKKPLDYFVLYRWLQHILVLPVDHILLPIYLQMFFCLYYQQVKDKITLGYLFFNKKSESITKLRDFIASAQTYYGQKMTHSGNTTVHAEVLQQTYYAMWLWLGNEDLLSSNVEIQELPAHYNVKRLEMCHRNTEKNQPWYQKENYWMDLINSEQLEQEFLNHDWEGADKFRIGDKKSVDTVTLSSSTINTRRQKFITGESTMIPLPSISFNTPKAVLKKKSTSSLTEK